jgi:hypothetical protein
MIERNRRLVKGRPVTQRGQSPGAWAAALRKLVPAELHHHELRDDGRYQLSLGVPVGEMAFRQIGAPLDLTTSASGKIRIVFNDPKALCEVERLPNPRVGNREVAKITRTRIAFSEPGTGLLAAATSIFNASGKLTDAGLKAVAADVGA